MRTRGRVSSAELMVPTLETIERLPRPDAPYSLTDEQAAVWRSIVNRMPADWFPDETHPLLTALCCHVIRRGKLERLCQQMEEKPSFDAYEYERMSGMVVRESRIIDKLMTTMRLTQQATYDHRKKTQPAQIEAPWHRTSAGERR